MTTADASSSDVLVIGAGAAGLAAARRLADAGLTVELLEARDRIGGRVWTLVADDGFPIEFGAEFVHGHPAVTQALAAEAGVSIAELDGEHWESRDGVLAPARDDFATLRSLMHGADALAPNEDMSFDEFIARYRQDPAFDAARRFARRLLEGFDAADPARASVRAIAAEWRGDASANARTGRPVAGYGTLLTYLAARLPPDRARVQLATPVRRVEWSPAGAVVTSGANDALRQHRARAVLVTVPLGVLQAPPDAEGAITFSPTLDTKRAALATLGSGGALRVVMRFRRAFWRTMAGGRLARLGFLHSDHGEPFPVVWTHAPAPDPVLTAWIGGPRTNQLALHTDEEITALARDVVGRMFGTEIDVRAELVSAHVHNWITDPFSRGSYSYVCVGGAGAHAALAAPLADTLYFAGEATDDAGEAATVAGALASGERAAGEIIARARGRSPAA